MGAPCRVCSASIPHGNCQSAAETIEVSMNQGKFQRRRKEILIPQMPVYTDLLVYTGDVKLL